MKLEDLWHHINGYLLYAIGATVAVFIDVVVGALTLLLNIPSSGNIRLQELIYGDKAGAMDKSEFIIRVVDGHLFLWVVSVTEVMQILLLTVSFIGASIKIIIDVHAFLKKRKEEKYKPFTSRLKK